MKVGDLIQHRGRIGILSKIVKNKYPPYELWYRVKWQYTFDCDSEWIIKDTSAIRKL